MADKLRNSNAFAILIYFALAFLLYRDCFSILIPADNYGQLYFFSKGNIMGVTEGNQNTSPYFLSFSIMFLLYKLVGLKSFGWITISISLHAANSFLVFLSAEKFIRIIFSSSFRMIAFFSGLFFLVSPYQTESVLWAPSDVMVLFTTTFFLLSLLFILRYFESKKIFSLFCSHAFFFLAVFSYESSFVLPAIVLIIYISYRSHFSSKINLKEFSVKVLLPQAGIIFSYLLVTKLFFGSWLWHSGEVDLAVSFSRLAGCFLKYQLKFFGFFRYWQFSSAETLLRSIYANPAILIPIFLGAATIFFTATFFLFRRKNKVAILLLILFICFSISLAPVLSLDSSFLTYIYPDRYGYLPSIFFYIFISGVMFFISRKMAIYLQSAYAILCLALLMRTIPVWISTYEYCNSLIDNYKSYLNYNRVYILDVPAYYHGIPAFRSAFRPTMYLKYNLPLDKISFISGSYSDKAEDTLNTVHKNGRIIQVKGHPRKTPYFSTDGGWAKSYETDEYSVTFDSIECSYIIAFKKEIPANSAFVYAANGKWVKAE